MTSSSTPGVAATSCACATVSPSCDGRSSLQRALEIVERAAPAVLVRAHGLLVPQPAVREVHGRDAVGLLEVELDQLPGAVAVPQPGEGEAPRRVDLRVRPAAAVLRAVVRAAHH